MLIIFFWLLTALIGSESTAPISHLRLVFFCLVFFCCFYFYFIFLDSRPLCSGLMLTVKSLTERPDAVSSCPQSTSLPTASRNYRVLLGFTEFYWVLLGFTEFYWVSQSWRDFFFGFWQVISGFTGFYRVSMTVTRFYWMFKGFT